VPAARSKEGLIGVHAHCLAAGLGPARARAGPRPAAKPTNYYHARLPPLSATQPCPNGLLPLPRGRAAPGVRRGGPAALSAVGLALRVSRGAELRHLRGAGTGVSG